MTNPTLRLIPSVVLYAVAALLLAYAIWSWTYSADVVSQARAAGQVTGGFFSFDILSFYMANSGTWFVYALLLAGTGLILQRRSTAPTTVVAPATLEEAGESDGELDEWFGDGAAGPTTPKLA
jgi:hypothetical protein